MNLAMNSVVGALTSTLMGTLTNMRKNCAILLLTLQLPLLLGSPALAQTHRAGNAPVAATKTVPAATPSATSSTSTAATPAAQTAAPPTTAGATPEITPETSPGKAASSTANDEFRSWLLNIHYSPFDLILPSKTGAALLYRTSADAAWELEYSNGALKVPFIIKDLGEVSETRISLNRRHSNGGVGFQFLYGVFYQTFTLRLGNEILSRLTSGSIPNIELIEIGSVGATIGLGYRWRLKDRFVLGVDGAAWAQPFLNTKRSTPFLDAATNANDRDSVDATVKLIQYLPRFSLLKVSAGFEF